MKKRKLLPKITLTIFEQFFPMAWKWKTTKIYLSMWQFKIFIQYFLRFKTATTTKTNKKAQRIFLIHIHIYIHFPIHIVMGGELQKLQSSEFSGWNLVFCCMCAASIAKNPEWPQIFYAKMMLRPKSCQNSRDLIFDHSLPQIKTFAPSSAYHQWLKIQNYRNVHGAHNPNCMNCSWSTVFDCFCDAST